MVFKQRDAKDSDLTYLSNNLRKADRNEVISCLNGEYYYDALFISYEKSNICKVILGDDDLPLFIYGVNKNGLIWALGTDKINNDKKKFVKTIKQYFIHIKKNNDILFNYIDERNAEHINFLNYLGFTILKDKYVERLDGTKALYFELKK